MKCKLILGYFPRKKWGTKVFSAVRGFSFLVLPLLVTAEIPCTGAEKGWPERELVVGCGDEQAVASSTGSQWQNVPTGDRKLWEVSQFGGEGEVEFSAESIVMEAGDPLTGVRCLVDMPRENFEIELQSRRLTNFDFFCGLTFPVGEGKCSLILGGWAGSVVGLSSIDGVDAARNQTKKLMHFDNERWYRVRVQVTPAMVTCWVDDEKVVEQARGDHKFDIRVEMDASSPLGVAAFQCRSEIRQFRWRKLPAVEQEKGDDGE